MIRAKTLQDLFKRYRRPGDLVFALLFLLFSVFLALSLDKQTAWATGTRFLAQPAFWSYAAVFTMVTFGLLHLISSLWSPRLEGRWREIGFWLRSLEYAGWFMAYVFLVPRLGYLPSTLLFCVGLAVRVGYGRPRYLLAAGTVALAIVVVFKSLLQVKVPGGQIYEHLPDTLRAFMLTYL